MEARDEPGSIRPIPPDLPEMDFPGGPSPSPRDRRWVPLAVAGGALVVFGVIAGVSSSPADQDADVGRAAQATTTIAAIGGPERTATTAVPVPPLLRELVPPLQRDLAIVYVEPSGVVTSEVTWTRQLDAPGAPTISGAAARAASFDVSRDQVMWITQGDARRTLWVGRPGSAEPVFIDVTSATWHASAPGALGWIGRPTGVDLPHLFTAMSLPGLELQDVADLGPVTEGTTLVAWGDWGFLLQSIAPLGFRNWTIDDPTQPGSSSFQVLLFTHVLDPSGTPVAAYPATPRAAGALGHLVVQPANEAFDLALAAGLDTEALGLGVDVVTLPRGPGNEPVVMLLPDLTVSEVAFELNSAVTTFAFHPGGTHVSAVGAVADRFAIRTMAVDGSGLRITSVEDVDTLIGHTRDGTLLILHDSETGAIVFHDWNRGASYRVPFDRGLVLVVDA